MTMFMVLSLWHSHCESSPGSFDECRPSAGWPQPSDQTNRFGLWVRRNIGCYHPQTPSTLYYYCYYCLFTIRYNFPVFSSCM